MLFLRANECQAISLPNLRFGATYSEKAAIEKIETYYKDVDKNKFEAVADRFDSKATYLREGWEPLISQETIKDFFKTKRKLRGTHIINKIGFKNVSNVSKGDVPLEYPEVVYVEGEFVGKNNGSPIELTFTDEWALNPFTNRVAFRKSTISKPGV